MARIRTIKPEFPQSESMGRVSRDSRLCFVLLWTLADDEGRLRGNSRMLASLLFPYDDDAPGRIDSWLLELETEGCLVRYQVEGTSYLQICKWLNHQKIDKPSKSRFPSIEEGSRIFSKSLESSSLDLGSKDLRIKDLGRDQGMDQVAQPSALCGSEKKFAEENQASDEDVKKEKPDTALQAACRATWARYSEAYRQRYGTEPLRTQKVNSQVKQFCQAVPHEEAPEVAEFFVFHNQSFYVLKGHDLGLLLSDAGKLRTEWATGRMVTGTRANQMDRTSSMLDAAAQVKRELGLV